MSFQFSILAASIVLGGSTVPASAASRESYILWKAYIDCLGTKALALEPSGASPDDLIKAAMTSCSARWADAFDKLEAEYSADPENGPSTAGPRALKMLNEGAEPKKDEVRLQILELRARRIENSAPNQ